MHRLFVALRPPPEIRSALLAAMGGIPGARWQVDAQLHLTLRFIGEVDGHVSEEIAIALSRVRHPPVTLAVAGLGTFDKKGRVHTLWAGVTPADSVNELHRKIDRAMIQLGLAAESRAYRPHITLARFGNQGGDVSGFAALHAGLASAPFTMDAFGLYESRLGSEGPTYECVAEYPLISSAPPSSLS